MKQIKQEIEAKLNALELNEAKELIDLYEQEAPMDLDLIAFQSLYYLYANDLDQALSYALLGIRRYPLTADLYYNLASIYEQKSDILNAYKNYKKTLFLYSTTPDEKLETLQLKEKTSQLDGMIIEMIKIFQQEGDLPALEIVRNYAEQDKNAFGLNEHAYKSLTSLSELIIGYRHMKKDMWEITESKTTSLCAQAAGI